MRTSTGRVARVDGSAAPLGAEARIAIATATATITTRRPPAEGRDGREG
jgi:hypothetical protein